MEILQFADLHKKFSVNLCRCPMYGLLFTQPNVKMLTNHIRFVNQYGIEQHTEVNYES